MTTNPHQAESDAIAAFLAASEGTLEQRARLWEAAKKQAEQSMKEKLNRGNDGKS